MNTLVKPFHWSSFVSIVFGIGAALIVFMTLTGRKVPMISGDRAAFVALAVVGFLMCSFGLSTTTAREDFSWLNPFTIVAVTLGALAFLLVLMVFVGWTLPLISSDREAMVAMAIIVFSKWGIAFIHRLVSL